MSRLHHIRTRIFGISQAEMAALLGVSQPVVSEFEKFDRLPERHQRTIRATAAKRKMVWSDEWLFEVPKEPAE